MIGWREWVRLPALGVQAVKAKVDTGARSSAIHAFDVHIDEDGPIVRVRFKIHPIQDESKSSVACEAPLFDRRWVRSSNGKRELRPVIRTELALMDETWPIDLTLTSRDVMGFRMLLGREAIRRRLLVDPGVSFKAPEFIPEGKERRKHR